MHASLKRCKATIGHANKKRKRQERNEKGQNEKGQQDGKVIVRQTEIKKRRGCHRKGSPLSKQ